MKLAITVELKYTATSQHQPGISNRHMGQEIVPGPEGHKSPLGDELHLPALVGVSGTMGHLKHHMTFLTRQPN